MGSFSELVMSFPLRADVGPDVLAAFASIAVPDPEAPALPPAVEEDPYESEWELDMPDCDMSEPWTHDWGGWLGASYTTAYIGSDQGATMRWRYDHWTVTARATWKAAPFDFVDNLAVLGTVIDTTSYPRYPEWGPPVDVTSGFLVGYARHEYQPRPTLLWAADGRLWGEDLNPPGVMLDM